MKASLKRTCLEDPGLLTTLLPCTHVTTVGAGGLNNWRDNGAVRSECPEDDARAHGVQGPPRGPGWVQG